MDSLLNPIIQKELLKKIFGWYRKGGRHQMTWRKTRDAYSILVSEFMLQQTTVATVGPYFDRFLKKFPTLESLALADINDVLALWSGLGYYARARNLWSAVRTVRQKYKGKIPPDIHRLARLPGIGPYTAGAIRSIAFNKPAAVLDGNIIRVLLRQLAIDDDPKSREVQAILKKVAEDLSVQSKQKGRSLRFKKFGPRHLTLALMDLGATVCLPRGPKCKECPVAFGCLAWQYGREDDIPLREDKFDRPRVRRLHAVLEKDGRWLMGRRLPEGLFGGLWEFIGVDLPKGIEPVPYLEKILRDKYDLHVRVRRGLSAFEHQLSHRIYVVRSYICDLLQGFKEKGALKGGKGPYTRLCFVNPSKMNSMGIAAITKRIVNEIHSSRIFG